MNAVGGPVHHAIVAANRINEKSKFCNSLTSLSKQSPECCVSRSRNCHESCMLRSRGSVLDETRQTGAVLF